MKENEKESFFSKLDEISDFSNSNNSSKFEFSNFRIKNKLILPNPFNQLITAWKIFIRNWQHLVLLTVIPMILVVILGFFFFFLNWITFIPFDQIESHTNDYTVEILGLVFLVSNSFFSNIPLVIFLTVVFLFFSLIVYLIISVAQLIVLKNDGRKIDLVLIIKQSFAYILKYFIFMILYSTCLLIGLLFLVIPGIIFMVWFGLGYLAVVFDDCKPIEAFKRSKELVKGYWWDIFIRFVFFAIFSFLVALLILLLRIILKTDYVAIISNLISLVMTPLSVAYFTVIYQDLKLIKENK